MTKFEQILSGLAIGTFLFNPALAQEHSEQQNALNLSLDTMALLQEEMRELLLASQSMAISIVSGDWASIQHLSRKIRDSYVMARNLTDTQKQELADKLPERFKQLDSEFHARAGRLESAAINKDAELTVFHYYRLLEACTVCHAEYAASRFPGFDSSGSDGHEH